MLTRKVLAYTFVFFVVCLAAAFGLGMGAGTTRPAVQRPATARTVTVTAVRTVTVTRTVRIVPSACRTYIATVNDISTQFTLFSASYRGTPPKLNLARNYILEHDYSHLQSIIDTLTGLDLKSAHALSKISDDLTDLPGEKDDCNLALQK